MFIHDGSPISYPTKVPEYWNCADPYCHKHHATEDEAIKCANKEFSGDYLKYVKEEKCNGNKHETNQQ